MEKRAPARFTCVLSITLPLLLSSGCGRVGLDLLPASDTETGENEPSGPPRTDLEASVPDAPSDGGLLDSTFVDVRGVDAAERPDTAIADASIEMDAAEQPDTGSDATTEMDAAEQPDASSDASTEMDAALQSDGSSDATTEVDAAEQPDAGSDATTAPDADAQPGCEPTGSEDSTCNGADDDCDGEVDEDYVPTAYSCGLGECRAMGVWLCIDGAREGTCAPGDPADDDALCNGLDDDCDGSIDEDYIPTSFSCGTGECSETGRRECIDGAVQGSCTPAAPADDDSLCNGLDDDCDGQVDEDYVGSPTSCGQGACQRSGSWQCVDGSAEDSCTPGQPLGSDDNSGVLGVDDDCDGEVDEDVVCSQAPMLLSVGAHHDLDIAPECTVVTAHIWGGGGAGAGDAGTGNGGNGGGGGYAESTFTLADGSRVDVFVGNGGRGCRTPGGNDGSPDYAGGAGGNGGLLSDADGMPGEDETVGGGGSGGNSSQGADGGRGHYGGGGGGSGNPVIGITGDGAGGGAATVLLVDGTLVMVAGGGGGGGGAAAELVILGSSGGQGGAGCSGNGQGRGQGGGGGGGGICIGDTVVAGSDRDPADPHDEIGSQGQGGNDSCEAGNGGYAILTFSR